MSLRDDVMIKYRRKFTQSIHKPQTSLPITVLLIC